jgi:hypothetical protein
VPTTTRSECIARDPVGPPASPFTTQAATTVVALIACELLVRAAMHRARLGDGAALDAVRPLAEAIANPALDAELALIA